MPAVGAWDGIPLPPCAGWASLAREVIGSRHVHRANDHYTEDHRAPDRYAPPNRRCALSFALWVRARYERVRGLTVNATAERCLARWVPPRGCHSRAGASHSFARAWGATRYTRTDLRIPRLRANILRGACSSRGARYRWACCLRCTVLPLLPQYAVLFFLDWNACR